MLLNSIPSISEKEVPLLLSYIYCSIRLFYAGCILTLNLVFKPCEIEKKSALIAMWAFQRCFFVAFLSVCVLGVRFVCLYFVSLECFILVSFTGCNHCVLLQAMQTFYDTFPLWYCVHELKPPEPEMVCPLFFKVQWDLKQCHTRGMAVSDVKIHLVFVCLFFVCKRYGSVRKKSL